RILDAAEKGDKDSLKSLFSKRLTETQLEIQRLKKIEEILLDKEKSLEILYVRTTEPVIKTVPKLRVLSRREIGSFSIVPRLIGELIQEIASPPNQRNLVKISGPIMYICHDTEFKETDATIEIAIPVSGRVTVQFSEIELKNIPGGRVISVIYTGPYHEINQAYTRVFEFAMKEDYEIRGPCVELYLNNPQETPEEELLTEIQIPIK
ncbi:MAG: GyrI-like domain-containing protein, partial [Candidatus Hodarchaeota archaeon]